MPDPIDILKALTAAAITAAVVFLVCVWPGRTPHPARASLGGALGVGLGCFVGCWLLELRPHWPPREDIDRLFLLLLPAVLVVELGATLLRRTPWLAWLLRAVIAASAARILLHDTTYLTELAGPGTREWTPTQTMAILTVLGLALVGVWALLALLAGGPLAVAVSPTAPEDSGRSVLVTLTLACAGAAVVVLLSGYAGGGLMGLALAAALAGVQLAALLVRGPLYSEGMLGMGVVGLFALLILGRFFGNLTTVNAILLFLAPLLGWLTELPYVRVSPRLRGLVSVVLVALPVGAALMFAQQKFAQKSSATAPNSPGATTQDYLNFGK